MDTLTRNLFIAAAIVALIVFPLFYYGGVKLFKPPFQEQEQEQIKWGVTFSTYYAKDVLGLNWQETYLALLDEMRVKYLRIPVYWREVESKNDQFDFSDYDWILEQASASQAKVVLVVGQKLPRWPECFVPEWAQKLKPKEREQELLEYMRRVVRHYQEQGTVEAWQIENEPYFNWFGGCPKLRPGVLNREIKLVKSLDSRPILISDAGEWGFWLDAALKGDIFGSTLYRQIWSPLFSHFTYPNWPAWFRFRRGLTKLLTSADSFWFIELQAEPWEPKALPEVAIEEQLKHMNSKKFAEYVKFAHEAGFERNYLWGAEWWYWLRVKHGNYEMWDTAKKLFIDGYESVVVSK